MPQTIFVTLLVIELSLVATLHGEKRPPYSFFNTALSNCILVGLLVWGGFFA